MTAITLTHGDARATIALVGAEARSWRIAERDLLWAGDPAIWSDISPILYPVVGWTRDGARVEHHRAPPITGSRCSQSSLSSSVMIVRVRHFRARSRPCLISS